MKVALLTSGGLAPCLSAAVGFLLQRYDDLDPDTEVIDADSKNCYDGYVVRDTGIVRDTAGDDSAVNSFYVNDSTGSVSNNLLHKDGNETKDGDLTMNGHLIHPLRGTPYIPIYIQTPDNFCHILDMDHLTTRLGMDLNIFGYRVFGRLNASKEPSGNSVGLVSISATTSYNLSFFWLYNSVTNKDELWVQTTTRPFRCGMDILSITTGNAMTSTRELSLVTVVNTTTAIDPSTDTSTYPDGKYLIPISEQVIT